ncbi:MAG: manganese efflux pump MntP family protein [Candidatus Bathyarchaeota archaeon]|nr:manganese efflux pump MntP family protein [Candidatus Bathyarchaeota archaeon]
MDIIIVLIALGLAMDSFSVSITRGFTNTRTRILNEALKTGFFFGLFQAIMPIIGWITGQSIINLISEFDHWIAFGLLIFIGARMIYESLTKESKQIVSSSSFKVLMILSIATSIDALAVGLSLSFLQTSIIIPAIIIGIITFSLSFLGVYIGKKFGDYFEKIGVIGGIILIIIGLRIIIEHLG